MSASPDNSPTLFRFAGHDPDQLREVIAGGTFDHTILEPGPCSLEVRSWSHEGIQLDLGRYSFPVIVRGRFPSGRLCIGMVRRMRIPTWINGSEVTRANLQVYAEDAELFYRAGPDVTWGAISVDREQLQRVAIDLLGRPLALPDSGVYNLLPDADALDRLEQAIGAVFEQLEDETGRVDFCRHRLMAACAEAIASADPDRAADLRERTSYRGEAIERADLYLRRNIGSRYSSKALCDYLGMSERNLQLYFREALGMSPKKWFQYLALHRARAELLRKDGINGVVTQVALNCGFEHLGRFAESYRNLFGETPSQTGG